MKPKSKQQAIFLQIGKTIAQSKLPSRKITYSLCQNLLNSAKHVTPSTAPHIYSYQNSIPCRRKSSIPNPARINKTSAIAPGMNDEFLYMRKENHLNTHFNLRKNKMKEITKENRAIYCRINSQKSLYSSIELNKSIQLNTSIKKRQSQSKLSQSSNSSHHSDRAKVNSGQAKRLRQKKQENNIEIKTSNINNIHTQDLQSFKGLFFANISKKKVNSCNNEEQKQIKVNSYRKNEKTNKTNQQILRKTVEVANTNDKNLRMGGLLHRIAQEMIPTQQKKAAKKPRGSVKVTKAFIF